MKAAGGDTKLLADLQPMYLPFISNSLSPYQHHQFIVS
jgi:hypothetical protein